MKVTTESIDAKITTASYFQIPGSTVTICQLTLQNGFGVIGQAACVNPANFDEQVGKTIAYQNARDQIWKLEGYLLKEQMYQQALADGTWNTECGSTDDCEAAGS